MGRSILIALSVDAIYTTSFFSQGYTEDGAPEVQNVQMLALCPDIGAYNVVDTSQTVQCV